MSVIKLDQRLLSADKKVRSFVKPSQNMKKQVEKNSLCCIKKKGLKPFMAPISIQPLQKPMLISVRHFKASMPHPDSSKIKHVNYASDSRQ